MKFTIFSFTSVLSLQPFLLRLITLVSSVSPKCLDLNSYMCVVFSFDREYHDFLIR